MIKITKRQNKAWVTFIQNSPAILKGDWNNWKPEALKKRKDHRYSITKVLACGQSYEFGYLQEGQWKVEEDLPTTPSPYQSQNSLLKV